MVNKKVSAGTASTRGRYVQAKILQHVSELRLWSVLAGVEMFMLTAREAFGYRNDAAEYISTSMIVLLSVPLLYIVFMRRNGKPAKVIGQVLALISGLELLEYGVRLVLRLPTNWSGELLSWAGTAALLVPLLYFVIVDIRHREFTERQLTYMAYHDVLTGLPNRQMFQKSLSLSIRGSKASKCMFAVLFIALDRFKNVNDTFGHAFGDLLLIEAADRLKAGLRPGDRVSRPSGGEFTVMLKDVADRQETERMVKSIIDQMSRPFVIDGHEVRVGCSVGISIYPFDGGDAVTLMKNADTAMYRAKDEGKNGFAFFAAEMNDSVIQKLVMEEWLNKAMEQNELMLYYQPQVDMTAGRVIGMEALIRWAHPRIGFISPAEFIPLAEETGLIIPLGKWILRKACMQNKAWQLQGYPPLKMAVNISPVQFYQHDFVQEVLDALNESGLEPKYLELEITEGVAMNHVDQVIHKLQSLRNLGVHIAMDDFGTGYSSLHYLKKFPIDKLKIAQQFVRDITVSPDDAAIVQAIMAMARSLKLHVIAEGVETEEQLDFLIHADCKEIQGYIYSKPLPAEEIPGLLERISA
ncbi:putative bifunctional diguanylate cyclase/phosphodiesterase [Paenibacillus allorhizosphaerae]|uniref:EAL domain-containing protein n=1 Tax=Paenibacillus allorhizosphaerae TaxID=2849866 RepID=A0ABN7TIV2_9BACL|nr:EAL domain-containing protein [Paenibacillus allorhizosphaerae]CAG7634205.1 hypothetical protein PAECIP111802_02025 [Paenibacillus allorhizosphaerae]